MLGKINLVYKIEFIAGHVSKNLLVSFDDKIIFMYTFRTSQRRQPLFVVKLKLTEN